jgi:DNA-binding GntR family transcriptional regulator
MPIMPNLTKNSTIAETILKSLSKEIVSGAIEPGMKLEEKTLADQYGVSRTPVRDALRQLSSTGLVEFRPRRGVTVVNMGIEGLLEMFETQSELEGLCARLAATRMTAVERLQLETLHKNSKNTIDLGNIEEYSKLNEQIHELIYIGAHNKSMHQITASFRQRLAPFRSSIFFRTKGRMTESYQEHGQIIEAISDSDADKAGKAAHDHTISSSVNVLDYFQNRKGSVESAVLSDPGMIVNTPLA